jgi:hypothetical protein
MEPAGGAAEEVRLVDRLRCADVDQLRRPVGRAHEQGHARQIGLHHGRVQLDRSRAAGGEHHRRLARREGQTNGQEPAAALVVVHVEAEPLILRQHQREGSGPRAGRYDGVDDTAARPLVHEGGAEGRLSIRGCHGHAAHIRPHG